MYIPPKSYIHHDRTRSIYTTLTRNLIQNPLMPNHSLMRRPIPIPMRLRSINNPPHLQLLLLRQLNLPRSPVLLQSTSLRRSGDSDESLRSNPGQRNLTNGAALPSSEFLDFVYDCAVFVEVFALEFGTWVEDVRRCVCCMCVLGWHKTPPKGGTWDILLRRKSSGAKSSGVLYGKLSTSHP